jgi:hypothetical protein
MEDPATGKVMLVIVCDQYAPADLIGPLHAAGVAHFTVARGAHGVGETGRREGTPVWPGENALLLCCLPRGQAMAVTEELRKLHDARPQHTMPLKVFCLPAAELL